MFPNNRGIAGIAMDRGNNILEINNVVHEIVPLWSHDTNSLSGLRISE